MLLTQPMAHGALVARYKRFFADVRLDDGREIVSHCPNPGAMLGLGAPGLGVWVSPAAGAKRKLAWTLELVEADGGLVGINTLHPNRLEVKNVHLRRGGTLAEFPDCVAARSLRHLKELAARVAEGERAVQLFVIQRTDCDRFAACADLDPAYAAGLDLAAGAGVEVLVYACDIGLEAIRIARKIGWRRP